VSKVLIFDVNETMLQLQGLDPAFGRVFGDAGVRQMWFQQVLQSMMVSTITGSYSDFSQIGRAALQMTAERRGAALSDADTEDILSGITLLEPYPDVPDSLERLRSAGFRLAALTVSKAQTLEAQLRHAGLREFFEQACSADEVQRLKPAPEPYRMAAERMGVPVGECRMIAAHAWDVMGAMSAALAAAFVARPNMVLDPLGPRPDVVGNDLSAVADQIIRRGP
jgi:2-haloacid dehalogenase